MKNTIQILIALVWLSACDPQTSNKVARSSPGPAGMPASASGADGTEQGNGSDYFQKTDGSAWFLGPERIIRYCFVTDNQFGATPEFIGENLVAAFAKWARYIESKRVYGKVERIANKLENLGNGRGLLATRSQLMSRCDGTEDIKFFFGVRDVRVNASIHKQSLGVAKRQSYDEFKGWSKGFIWIAPAGSLDPREQHQTTYEAGFPRWNLSYNLLGVLLHELGHVYGCAHVDNTIMDERYSTRLGIGDENQRALLLGRIDSWKELYVCDDCPIDVSGKLGIVATTTSQDKTTVEDGISESFKFLTGREPEGGYSAVKARLIGGYVQGGYQFKLKVSDTRESFEFSLNFDGSHGTSTSSASLKVFRVVHSSKESDRSGTYAGATSHTGFMQSAYSVPGNVRTATGSMESIILGRNMDTGHYMTPLQISFLKDGRYHILFGANLSEIGD
jgi:hypothetical protein